MMEDPTGKGIPFGKPSMGKATLMAALLLAAASIKVEGAAVHQDVGPDTTETAADYLERERRQRAKFPSRKKRLRMRRG